MRWDGEAFLDAVKNWIVFEDHHEDIVGILAPYLRDCWVSGVGGEMHNPEGTLTAWLWKCSAAHSFIWDFCEHYQRAHLRRGLIAYCKQVIREIEAKPDPAAGHPEVSLDFETPAYQPARWVKVDGKVMPAEEYRRERRAEAPRINIPRHR